MLGRFSLERRNYVGIRFVSGVRKLATLEISYALMTPPVHTSEKNIRSFLIENTTYFLQPCSLPAPLPFRQSCATQAVHERITQLRKASTKRPRWSARPSRILARHPFAHHTNETVYSETDTRPIQYAPKDANRGNN